jgi:signal transduction histidine kinase
MVAFQEASTGQAIDNVRATFVTKDGRAIPVEGNATSRVLDGKVIATHSFFRDISERLHTEELEARNRELERERLVSSLEKMAALGKMAAGLAHELNNPAAAAQRAASRAGEQIEALQQLTIGLCRAGLDDSGWELLQARATEMRSHSEETLDTLALSDREDAISGWLDARGVENAWEVAPELVRGGLDEAALEGLSGSLPPATLSTAFSWLSTSRALGELVQTVAVSTHSISDLVSAVKEYSYMDRAPEQEVDIHDGIENTLRILGHRSKSGVIITREFDRTLPRITVPAGELNQVWTNLIDNAIDAAAPGGEVRIRTTREGEGILVEVSDNGAGIPADIQDQIFEPFFTTKARGHGTGLGLEVVRQVVSGLCGGHITFESQPGATHFRVWLPFENGETAADAGG